MIPPFCISAPRVESTGEARREEVLRAVRDAEKREKRAREERREGSCTLTLC